MNRHESDYDKYRRRAKRIRIAVFSVLFLAVIIYIAGPLANRVRNGGPGLYDLIREKTGVETIEHYTGELKESLNSGEAEIAEYEITPHIRPVYDGNTLSIDFETGRISSTNGKFTDEYKLMQKSNTSEYMINSDASEIVVMKGEKLYHIDSELNVTTISEDVYGYRLSHDGGVIGYITNDNNLYLYNEETKEHTLVDESVYTFEVSPNGKYFFYERSGIDARYLAITDVETMEKTIISRDLKNVKPIFVSIDGRTAYYFTFEGGNDKYSKDAVYCLHDGKETKVYDNIHDVYYTNASAEELFFYDAEDKKVVYYNPAMSGGVVLFETEYANIKPAFSYTEHGRLFIVDSNNIRDGLRFVK